MSAGKGDKPRPINKRVYDENYDKIFRMYKSCPLSYCPECSTLLMFLRSDGNGLTSSYECPRCRLVLQM